MVSTSGAAGTVGVDSATGRWVLAASIGGSGVAMLDATVVNVALARIGADLNLGFAGLQWISNAYTLTLASFILVGGVLGDRFGRRRIFVIGAVWFAVASVLCAASANASMLIAARALQGVGGALLTPGSLAIISATFVREDRARAIGIWSGLGGIASAAGPFIGGWLVELNWRWVFGVNLPLAIAVIIIALRHVPESREPAQDARPVDATGSMILVVTLAAVTFGLTRVGESGWSPVTVMVCVIAAAGLIAFVQWERTTSHPLVELGIFADRVFTATNVVTVFVYAALGVYFFLVVIQLQVVSGWSPIAAGTAMLPATLVMLLLSGRFGALSERVGARPLMAAGSLLAAAGFLLSLRFGAHADFLANVLPAVLVLGLGLSCVVAPLTASVLAAVPDGLAGAASGINNAVARSAGLLAVVNVPAAAGLSSAGLSNPAVLGTGYRIAMIIGALLLIIGAAAAWWGVGAPTAAGQAEQPTVHDRLAVHRGHHCAVSGPPLHPVERVSPSARD